MVKERLFITAPSVPSQDLSELCHLDISYNHLRLVPKMGPSGAALGTLILRGNELQSLHGEWGTVLGWRSSPAWKGMGAVLDLGWPWIRVPTRASCGPQTGVGCPGWPFCHAFPQHAPSTPLHSTPPHAPPPLLTHSLAHTSPLISAPGLEQLRNLRHLDVAYNLLERHRELAPLWLLTELRKVRTGKPASCPHSPHAEWISPLPHIRRPQAHLSLLFLCPALPGGEPFVVPP